MVKLPVMSGVQAMGAICTNSEVVHKARFCSEPPGQTQPLLPSGCSFLNQPPRILGAMATFHHSFCGFLSQNIEPVQFTTLIYVFDRLESMLLILVEERNMGVGVAFLFTERKPEPHGTGLESILPCAGALSSASGTSVL